VDALQPLAGVHFSRFRSWFATDEDCLDYLDCLDWLRWPDSCVCPRGRVPMIASLFGG